MAPAVCVTSFRLLMRRPDLAGQLSRGLRLTPAGSLTANSWSTKARRFCTKSDDTTCPDDEQPITGKTKSINEKASPQNDGPTKARDAQTAQTAVAASVAAAAVAAATATAAAAAVRLQSGKSMQTHSQTPKTPHPNEPLVSDEDFVPDADYGRMRVSQLRAKLRAHGLSTVGKKDALINRLENYLQLKMNAPGYRTLPYDLQEDNADAAHATQTTTTATEATATAPLADIVGKMPEERGERATSTPSSETSAATPVEESATAARATDDQPQASAILNLSSAAAPIKVDLPSEYVDGLAASDRSNSRTAARKASSHSSSGGGSGNANDGNGDGDGGGKRNSANNPPTRSTTANGPPQRQGDAFVEYIHGLPHLTVPLPSRRENCRFALKPVSHKVGDLVEMLKTEDRGIDRATVLNNCGVRIASTCNIDSLMDEPFVLQINDTKYEVVPPKRQKIDVEDINKLGDVRSLVAQLYEALHVGEYHLHKEQELVSKLENLQHQLSPLEMQKEELSKQADRKTIIMTWVGLGLMSVQFGILARLTWWEYSWDIMEPVTYFVTYGTTMAMYAYYCVTKTEYTFDEVRRRQFLFTIHKRAQKKKFDVETYNSLKRQIAEIEYDLRRLRDPINLQLPPHIDRAQRGPPASPPSSVPLTIVKKTSTLKKPGGFRLPFLEPKK